MEAFLQGPHGAILHDMASGWVMRRYQDRSVGNYDEAREDGADGLGGVDYDGHDKQSLGQRVLMTEQPK